MTSECFVVVDAEVFDPTFLLLQGGVLTTYNIFPQISWDHELVRTLQWLSLGFSSSFWIKVGEILLP